MRWRVIGVAGLLLLGSTSGCSGFRVEFGFEKDEKTERRDGPKPEAVAPPHVETLDTAWLNWQTFHDQLVRVFDSRGMIDPGRRSRVPAGIVANCVDSVDRLGAFFPGDEGALAAVRARYVRVGEEGHSSPRPWTLGQLRKNERELKELRRRGPQPATPPTPDDPGYGSQPSEEREETD